MTEPASQEKDQARGIIGLAVERPVAVSMIVLAVAVFGFVSYGKLTQTLLPRISYPSLTVRTEFEGAAPAEVEELVTKTLESNLSVISRLNNYRSISRAGASDIILEFEWNTNMSFAAQDVREKVDQVRAFLPQDAEKPLLLKYDPTLDPVMRIGLFGGDLTRMRFVAEERIKKELESLTGVAAVRIRGGFESEIRIDIDERELRRAKIAIDDIQRRLREENVNLASGLLREGDVEYLVRTLNEFKDIEEIRDLVVATRGDQIVRLRDVATVRLGTKEPDVVTRINGRESVEVAIFKEDSANIISVAEEVKRTIYGIDWRQTLVNGELDKDKAKQLRAARGQGQKKGGSNNRGGGRRGRGGEGGGGGGNEDALTMVERLPPGFRFRLLSDQSQFVEQSLSEVRQSGLFGGLFAVVVLLLFLRRFASTLSIALSIPISVVATFGPMLLFDVNLNVMSLGGLALGIGMLVDASIVVLESIERRRAEGLGLTLAAIKGTRDVASAVVASVLTTIAVFLPIVFVEGVAGEIFKDQALTVVFSLLTSLAVALLFIPVLSARPLLAGRGPNEIETKRSLEQRLHDFWDLLKNRVFPHPMNWLVAQDGRAILGKKAGLALLIIAFPVLLLKLAFELFGRGSFLALSLIFGVFGALFALIFSGLQLLFRPIAIAFDFAYQGVESVYALLIKGALRLRLLVVLAAIALGWVAWQTIDQIGLELVPEMRSGEIIVEAPQKTGTSLTSTSLLTRDIEKRLASIPEDELPRIGFSARIGIPRDEIAPAGEGSHSAKIYLQLADQKDMAAAEEAAKDRLRESLNDSLMASEPKFSTPKLFTFKNPLEIQIRGDDITRIETIGRRLVEDLRGEAFLADLKSTAQEGSPEFVIVYDRLLLAEFNLTLAEAAGRIRDKIRGVVPTKFSVPNEGRKIDVRLQIPEESMIELEALRNIQVNRADQDVIRLDDVAEVIQGRGPSEIRRVSGERAVLVTAAPRGVDLGAAASGIESAIDRLREADPLLFRGVATSVAGQTEEAARSSKELGFALLLALILVYIVMASQFESLIDPLIIMVSSVFAGVGAIFALAFFGIAASVVVFIGGIMLAGIVVNNAIVLIDNINRLHREGLSRRASVIEGARMRLRPILMTTMTTILGLLPMALSRGEGAEMRVPMAVTVIAGLASSTILTLVIIPVLHSLVHEAIDFIRGDKTEIAA